MTAYVNSIQQISITLSSATSNTATVSSPTGKYFILWQGQTTTGTANQAVSQARIEITNSTTITAFLNTSGTVTVNAVLIDATSSLITSVQSGTVTWGTGATSGTATITSVTNANTAIAWLGYTTTETGFGLSNNDTIVSLSGTTVTVSKQFAGFTETTGFCVIEFAGAALNSSVQNVAATTPGPSSATWTKTITSVNRSNSFMVWGGSYGNSTANSATVQPNAQLTAATTITFTTGASSFVSQQVNLCVVEFATGVLNSAVQRATVATSSSTSNTATITSVSTSNAFVNFLSNNTNDTAGSDAKDHGKITLTNATTVTFTINTAATDVASFEIVEFAAGSTAWALTLSQSIVTTGTDALSVGRALTLNKTITEAGTLGLKGQFALTLSKGISSSLTGVLARVAALALTKSVVTSLSAVISRNAGLTLTKPIVTAATETLTCLFQLQLSRSIVLNGSLNLVKNAALALTKAITPTLTSVLQKVGFITLSQGVVLTGTETLTRNTGLVETGSILTTIIENLNQGADGAFNHQTLYGFSGALTSDRGLTLNQTVTTALSANLGIVSANRSLGTLGDANLIDFGG